ncbi:Egl nine 3 [Rhizophlyctis rosea]|uniref:procollagen-lysine 5-dioxygenase n=1 Tax=Rhizophlyctis rosea TaxID=64517 RepID=A0AAD5SF21_9FUNG|nr:Egl nine 3 [Rhizophlyctis rosea]
MEQQIHSLPDDLQLKILSLLAPPSPAPSARPVPPATGKNDLSISAENLFPALSTKGFCVVDRFLDDAIAKEVLDSFKHFVQNGELRPAKVGTRITEHIDTSVRGDQARFLLNSHLSSNRDTPNSTNSASVFRPFCTLKEHFDTLASSMNDALTKVEGHIPFTSKGLQLGYYPGNATRYAKHRDSSPLNPHRKITMILYLNADWAEEDGGYLRVHREKPKVVVQPDVASSDTEDLAPLFNRLVIFRSDMEHEVLPSYGNRYAITMWLYSPLDLTNVLDSYAKCAQSVSHSESETIFVSIPSYRDPETNATISSLLSMADHKERVYVGVLYQDHPTEDANLHTQNPLPTLLNIRTLRWSSTEAKGPAYARAAIAKHLYRNEKYYFQIDSHCRFAKGWDTHLISNLRAASPAKSLITMYPPSYTLRNDLSKPPYGPIIMRPQQFDEDGMLRITGRLTFPPPEPKPDEYDTLVSQPFLAAGCLFAPAQQLLHDLAEGGNDPDQWAGLFFGEEVAQSVILWTRGWRFWTPRDGMKPVLWHLWQRSHRSTFQENFAGVEGLVGQRKESQRRVRNLVGMKEGEVKMPLVIGRERSVEEFERACRVKFAERRVC